MALNMDTVVKMPIYQKVLILLFVIITLACFFYYFVEMKKGEEIKAKANELCLKVNEVEQLKVQDCYKAKLKEIIKDYETQQMQFLKNLPQHIEMEGLLKQLDEIGSSIGIRNAMFKLLKPNDTSLYREIPIEMKFYGSFPYVMEFFSEATQEKIMPRIVTFRSVKMKATKGKEIEVSCVASTYQFLPKK